MDFWKYTINQLIQLTHQKGISVPLRCYSQRYCKLHISNLLPFSQSDLKTILQYAVNLQQVSIHFSEVELFTKLFMLLLIMRKREINKPFPFFFLFVALYTIRMTIHSEFLWKLLNRSACGQATLQSLIQQRR